MSPRRHDNGLASAQLPHRRIREQRTLSKRCYAVAKSCVRLDVDSRLNLAEKLTSRRTDGHSAGRQGSLASQFRPILRSDGRPPSCTYWIRLTGRLVLADKAAQRLVLLFPLGSFRTQDTRTMLPALSTTYNIVRCKPASSRCAFRWYADRYLRLFYAEQATGEGS